MKRYGLIGERLGHSYSKVIHEQLASYTYDLIPLNKEEFHDFMSRKEFSGINVTIPYKCDVLPYLDHLDKSAAHVGAVNTIVNKDGTLTGYNTDYSGFLYTLEAHNIKIKEEKVLVLGYGGASKAILAVLKDLGASEIIIANRTLKDGVVSYEEAINSHNDVTVIINTTPVGMYPNTDASPIDLSHFGNLSAVVDIIYNPLKTKLLLQAEAQGIIAVNGLEMLIAQAKDACQYFLDTSLPESKITEILAQLEAELKTK
ncbi:MAG: shikimate dehydrogenase [bacterium]|nr:shikimate dehydrogenase [bacterium]